MHLHALISKNTPLNLERNPQTTPDGRFAKHAFRVPHPTVFSDVYRNNKLENAPASLLENNTTAKVHTQVPVCRTAAFPLGSASGGSILTSARGTRAAQSAWLAGAAADTPEPRRMERASTEVKKRKRVGNRTKGRKWNDGMEMERPDGNGTTRRSKPTRILSLFRWSTVAHQMRYIRSTCHR